MLVFIIVTVIPLKNTSRSLFFVDFILAICLHTKNYSYYFVIHGRAHAQSCTKF